MVQYGKTNLLMKRLNWAKAIDYCENLSFGGYNNWKLPSRDSLKKLYKNKNKLKYVSSYFYWSSTTSVSSSSNASWVVLFRSGDDVWYSKGGEYRVRCVRGGQ